MSAVTVVLLFWMPVARQQAMLSPSPELSPAEVVHNQLEALRHNDYPDSDAGIAVIFSFMAAEHKLRASNLDEFIKLWHNPVYQDMLNMQTYKVEEHFVEEEEAVFFVFLESQDAEKAMYIFELHKVTDGPMAGAWLNTDVQLYDKVVRPGKEEVYI